MRQIGNLFPKACMILIMIFLLGIIYAPIATGEERWVQATIDHTKVNEDLVDFPVMLTLNDDNAWDFIDVIVATPGNSLKFRIEDSQGRQCYVEKELWDDVGRKVILHVKVPYVSAAEDTEIKLIYDETMVDNTAYVGGVGSVPGQNVWDGNFLGVWHLSESPAPNGIHYDATVNGYNGVFRDANANSNTGATGLIGGADQLAGDADYIAIEDFNYAGTGHSAVTVESLISTTSGADQVIVSYDRSAFWRLEINGDGAGTGQIGWDVTTSSGILDFASNTRIDDGLWHHVVAVYDNGSSRIYIDGVLDRSASLGNSFGTSGSESPRFGYIGVGSESGVFDGAKAPEWYYNGFIDEVRISGAVRSAAWIKAIYHSLFGTLIGYSRGPDADNDGITDFEETGIYGTNPNLVDTDGDGIGD